MAFLDTLINSLIVVQIVYVVLKMENLIDSPWRRVFIPLDMTIVPMLIEIIMEVK